MNATEAVAIEVTIADVRIVEVTIRNVYGADKVYPANDLARSLAELAGTTTLTPRALAIARDMGMEVRIKSGLSADTLADVLG